jgi:hypothetical protein
MKHQRCDDNNRNRRDGHDDGDRRAPGSVVDPGDRHDKGEQSLCVGEAA